MNTDPAKVIYSDLTITAKRCWAFSRPGKPTPTTGTIIAMTNTNDNVSIKFNEEIRLTSLPNDAINKIRDMFILGVYVFLCSRAPDIPPVEDIAQRFSVNPLAVNHAISYLVTNGYIERIH